MTGPGAPTPAGGGARALGRARAVALAGVAPDALIKERVAVLAAGPEQVAAWVQDCLLPDVRLVPGTRRRRDRLGAAGHAGLPRGTLAPRRPLGHGLRHPCYKAIGCRLSGPSFVVRAGGEQRCAN